MEYVIFLSPSMDVVKLVSFLVSIVWHQRMIAAVVIILASAFEVVTALFS